MIDNERRSLVREYFGFNVQYEKVTPREYEELKERQRVDIPPTVLGAVGKTDANLINFLCQMDEKLDRILDLLHLQKGVRDPIRKGAGINISGSGMKIIAAASETLGQILYLKVMLSKFPLTYLDVFGKVVSVTPAEGEAHQLGIEFFNLNENDREKIISSVFQRQRDAIRRKKTSDRI